MYFFFQFFFLFLFAFSFTARFHFHIFAGEKLALQTMLFSMSGDFALACFPALSLFLLHPLPPFSKQQVEAGLPLHQHPPRSSLLAAFILFYLPHPSSSASLPLIPGVCVSARHTGSRWLQLLKVVAPHHGRSTPLPLFYLWFTYRLFQNLVWAL